MVFILQYQRKEGTKEWKKYINYCPQSRYINYQEHLCIFTEHKLIGCRRQNMSNSKKNKTNEIRLVPLTSSLLENQLNMLLDKQVSILHKDLSKLQNDQRLLQYHNVKL